MWDSAYNYTTICVFFVLPTLVLVTVNFAAVSKHLLALSHHVGTYCSFHNAKRVWYDCCTRLKVSADISSCTSQDALTLSDPLVSHLLWPHDTYYIFPLVMILTPWLGDDIPILTTHTFSVTNS